MRFNVRYVSICLVIILLTACNTSVDTFSQRHDGSYAGYLFTYFTGNGPGEEAIHYAISTDGYRFRALNGDEPILESRAISSTGGVRDPHILRSPDGSSFRMVATDMVSANGWDSNRAMVLLKSDNLLDWTSTVVNIQDRFDNQDSLRRVWAPQTIWDPAAEKYLVYWSMKHGDRGADIIYYAYANDAFTDLETAPRPLLTTPDGGAAIDGDIVFHDGTYHLFFKTEDRGKGLKIATADRVTGPYTVGDEFVQQTTFPVEGSSVYRRIDGDDYILMYDMYTKGEYQFVRTPDLKNFEVIDEAISMDFHPRHGTVIPITHTEMDRLLSRYGRTDDLIGITGHAAIKRHNLRLDTQARRLVVPVVPGTDLTAFDPGFLDAPGLGVAPTGSQDFSAGPVAYTLALEGQPPVTYEVSVEPVGNPVLTGYYADPDVLYSENTGKFYLYPTSDGFNGWSGTYFKAFSSDDLVHWKDEGVILDLEKDVAWADRNAWAPCILEARVDGAWKYFYYFTAAQRIGVAVGDSPTGPFRDSGRPLVAGHPAGIEHGQEIDPEVFTDPQTGKSFLYWGNGYLAVAELTDDYTALKAGTTRIITPDAPFREGATVFFRDGRYYLLWSENDTRDPEYRVRYATASGPTGPFTVPGQNLVIAFDERQGIYGTGHNSVLQFPGKDEWFLVYHRFTYPQGIGMGRKAGFHREVAIDRLTFDDAGRIEAVRPTHAGVVAAPSREAQ